MKINPISKFNFASLKRNKCVDNNETYKVAHCAPHFDTHISKSAQKAAVALAIATLSLGTPIIPAMDVQAAYSQDNLQPTPKPTAPETPPVGATPYHGQVIHKNKDDSDIITDGLVNQDDYLVGSITAPVSLHSDIADFGNFMKNMTNAGLAFYIAFTVLGETGYVLHELAENSDDEFTD